MKNKILCIEDDVTIQTLVEASLNAFEVICVQTLKEAEETLRATEYSAILIDIQLPDGDGLRFLAKLSHDQKFNRIPMLIFSDHSDISNKVMAFTFGADDFIAKPFDPIELNARISAKIKKQILDTENSRNRKLGNVLIDFDRQKAFLVDRAKESDLGLTGIELKILSLLTKRPEQVYSREQIMDQVWGQTFITERTVDSHVAHLRQKIENTKLQIETAKSLGYRAVLRS